MRPEHESIPCGHVEDALSIGTTNSLLIYCHRCERGFEAPVVPA